MQIQAKAGENMYEINKAAFGEFLAKLRKEKGYTQKELAGKLFVSDKAVSKWERALSMPDISLLIPLAEILGVSVTELLEGRRLDRISEMDVEKVEVLVKKALTFSEDAPEKTREKRRKRAILFGGCTAFALLETFVGWRLDGSGGFLSGLLVFLFMSFFFGVYFWFFMRDRLPAYYDENKIHAVYEGFFRMNVPGVHFNNSNWQYIARYLRGWSAVTLLVVPLAGLFLSVAVGGYEFLFWVRNVFLIVYLATLFVPVYVIGRKYGMEERAPEKKAARRAGAVVLAVIFLIAFILLVSAGTGSFRSATRIGYFSNSNSLEWSADYRFLDGWMTKKLFLSGEARDYRIEVRTESGSLSVTLTDKQGNVVFCEEDMQNGVFPVRLEGTTKVEISADRHRGGFSIVPE